MIRAATLDDATSVAELAIASGLFAPDEVGVVRQLMTEYFDGKDAEGHACIVDEEGEPLGVAYYQPAAATDGTWYLTMIAVRADRQGQGRGTGLLHHMEDALRLRRQRLLLVETSGLEAYEQTGALQEMRLRAGSTRAGQDSRPSLECCQDWG